MNAIAMAWYTPASYAAMQAVAGDRDGWNLSFREFVVKAERMIADFECCGICVEKVLIDVDDCERWCRRNGYRLDQTGRAAYGAAMLIMRDDMPAGGSA